MSLFVGSREEQLFHLNDTFNAKIFRITWRGLSSTTARTIPGSWASPSLLTSPSMKLGLPENCFSFFTKQLIQCSIYSKGGVCGHPQLQAHWWVVLTVLRNRIRIQRIRKILPDPDPDHNLANFHLSSPPPSDFIFHPSSLWPTSITPPPSPLPFKLSSFLPNLCSLTPPPPHLISGSSPFLPHRTTYCIPLTPPPSSLAPYPSTITPSPALLRGKLHMTSLVMERIWRFWGKQLSSP